MIGEFLLNIIFGIVSGFLSLLPPIDVSVDSSVFEYFLDIVRVASYMLPMGTVSAILSLIVALTIFRIVIAFIKAVWDLLPAV